MPYTVKRILIRIITWAGHVIASSIVLAILIFIVINFYIFSSIVNLDSFFYAFLLLSLLTDGLFTFLHMPRRRAHSTVHQRARLAPAELTVLIPCFNGEDVIGETIKGAAVHVPLDQIIVASDASTDRTAEVARAAGVRVFVNEKNLQKAANINAALCHVQTPYVLLLDDDMLIGDTSIPTSLLDEGYAAVAFNVMPVAERTIINELQRLEYRTSMQMGKHMRATAGAVGNVSGAIGLYRTDDLRRQVTLHSGQFAGEDEQRTLLAHMYSEGKGVTYTDSLALTKAPNTYRTLFRQRAFIWSLSVPELFLLYWRVLLSARFHFLLKAEKAYLIYVYLTDPLRILFLWTLILRPAHIATTYGFYLALNLMIWLRLGREDSLRAVILSPLYALGLNVCRFIGYFYWLIEKTRYLARKLHVQVTERHLLVEYGLMLAVIIVSWTLSVRHFINDVHVLNSARGTVLTNDAEAFNYTPAPTNPALIATDGPADTQSVSVQAEQGDTPRALAHKALDQVLAEEPAIMLNDAQRWQADMWLAARLPQSVSYQSGQIMRIPTHSVQEAIAVGQSKHS